MFLYYKLFVEPYINSLRDTEKKALEKSFSLLNDRTKVYLKKYYDDIGCKTWHGHFFCYQLEKVIKYFMIVISIICISYFLFMIAWMVLIIIDIAFLVD